MVYIMGGENKKRKERGENKQTKKKEQKQLTTKN